jgi:hypothetical protein
MQRGKTRTLAPMSEQFEDVSRWPVARYLRAVVAAQPDGRVLLFAGKVNWCIGFLIACSLIFMPISHLAWVHVVVFLGMPLIGFLWFIRNMPSPQLTPMSTCGVNLGNARSMLCFSSSQHSCRGWSWRNLMCANPRWNARTGTDVPSLGIVPARRSPRR